MPKGAVPEGAVSHFAHRVIDNETRKAYSADELIGRIEGVNMPPYDGEPVNYSAAVQATCDWVVGATTVAATAIPIGAAGNITVLNIKDPEGPNSPIEVIPNANEIDAYPATSAGDTAAAEITTSGTAMVVKHCLPSNEGNGRTITFALAKLPLDASFGGGTVVLPSQALSATYDAQTKNVAVALGTAAGVTAAKLTLTESVGASGGQLKIEQRAGYIGTWANTKLSCSVALAGTSTPLSVAISGQQIVINLATTGEGAPDAAANTDTAVVAAVQAAMDAHNFNIGAATKLGTALLCTRLSDGSKIFSSPNPPVTMGDGTGSNTAGVDALADNTANAVAFLKTALEALPPSGDKFDVTTDGTGHVSGANTETFAGGGLNYASTSTVNEIIAAIEALPALDHQFTLEITAGDGTDVVPIGGDVLVWDDSGVDEVLGTPATLGRLATDGTDVWTALKNDPTTTQDGWVKTFTATP
jgi:hypothetical protein